MPCSGRISDCVEIIQTADLAIVKRIAPKNRMFAIELMINSSLQIVLVGRHVFPADELRATTSQIPAIWKRIDAQELSGQGRKSYTVAIGEYPVAQRRRWNCGDRCGSQAISQLFISSEKEGLVPDDRAAERRTELISL